MKNLATNQQINQVTANIEEEVTHRIYELKEKLSSIDKQILTDFSEAEYYQAIKALPRTSGYYFIPQELRDGVDDLKSRYGQSVVSLYHRLILSFLIQKSFNILQNSENPKDVVLFYKRHFEWIFQNLIVQNIENIDYYDYKNDLFLKDLGICSLRIFPFGAQVVELLGISRRFILSHGFSQFLNSSYFYLAKMRGNSPFYHVHLDTRWISDFNKAGWYRFFKFMAEMLKRNPDIRGVFGSSWFYDPNLEKISPGLLYLRKIPELGGAKIFKWGRNSMDVENAICKSERRRSLYEEGKYMPTSYVFIWSRDDLIRWADSSSSSFS